MFGIQLSVFNRTLNGVATFTDFCLLCAFPTSQWWRNYKLPIMSSFVHISGEVLGFYQVGGRRSLCLIIHKLSFLSGRVSSQISSPSSAPASASASKTSQN
jgi:hypothetical protein